MWFRILRCAASSSSVAVALLAEPAHGQRLSGVVLDSTGAPVGASVRVLPGTREARTDSAGRFAFSALADGTYLIIASSIGLRPDTSRVRVSGADVAVTLRLSALHTLETVIVTGYRDRLPRVAEREQRGLGVVMYADEIERRNPYDVLDLIRGAPSLGMVVGASRRRPPLMFVDGVLLRNTFDPLLTPHPRDIAAIEVHRGFAGMRDADVWLPPHVNYSTSRRIIFIWTKQYVELDEKRRAVYEADRARQGGTVPPPR